MYAILKFNEMHEMRKHKLTECISRNEKAVAWLVTDLNKETLSLGNGSKQGRIPYRKNLFEVSKLEDN